VEEEDEEEETNGIFSLVVGKESRRGRRPRTEHRLKSKEFTSKNM
jgi:hypothetical protein